MIPTVSRAVERYLRNAIRGFNLRASVQTLLDAVPRKRKSPQKAEKKARRLLKTPAAVRFLSCEPLLGPVNLESWLHIHEARWTPIPSADFGLPVRDIPVAREVPAIDWVIVGGESGPGARPMQLEWARALVDQCTAAGVKVFVKQMGDKPFEQTIRLTLGRKGKAPSLWPGGPWPREFPEVRR